MREFIEKKPEAMTGNPFQLLGSDWMLVTARKGDEVNTLTAAWGGLGIMWAKPVAFIVLRPQRFTREFVDAAENFSLSFFGSGYRQELNYLGTVSGRDEPKIERSGLTLIDKLDTPCFAEAEKILICRKLYRQQYDPALFTDPALDRIYPEKDYHIQYIGEVLQVLEKEA